jgi:hypothetical protein
VRDVFVAPGGCILVRADLWPSWGFDAGIVAMGEDLDLSWRSQVAGSRVVVAPDARVRHREVVAGGLRAARRHRLTKAARSAPAHHAVAAAAARAAGGPEVLWVVPPDPGAAAGGAAGPGRVVVALLARDRVGPGRGGRLDCGMPGIWVRIARSCAASSRPTVSSPTPRFVACNFTAAPACRAISPGCPIRGSTPPTPCHLAWCRRAAREHDEVGPLLTGSVGLAFSEDSDFDELDDLGHRSGRDRFGRSVRAPMLSTGRHRVIALAVAAIVLVAGSRELFFGSLPLVGQLASLPSWTGSWQHFFSGWQPAGVGTTAPSSPAFGIVGIVGTIFFGAMGVTQRFLILGCIPLGALGFSRFIRPLVSPRARLVATICYLGLPLPYGALGAGRWDGLVAYAAFPFIVTRLARSAGMAPFEGNTGRGWKSTSLGQLAVLGAMVAGATSFAPAVLPMTLVCALAMALGSVLVGHRDAALQVVLTALKGIGVAVALCLPWVVGTLLAGSHAVEIFGLPISAAAAPSWGEVIRFAIGPAARSPIVWLLVAAAGLPLLLGTGARLLWAARMWSMACASWVFAFAVTHGWTGAFTPSESVVLVPAAIAVAGAIGLGISSFENDLAGLAFGWRQVVSGVALVAVAVGLLPVTAGAVNGRWGLAATGIEQPLAFLDHPTSVGAERILWLGDPRALPVGGWSVQPGLSYALTSEALPDATDVWTPAGPGPSTLVENAVHLAITGGTIHLGRLLAAEGVRYVIVVDGLSPSQTGQSPSYAAPPPMGIGRALLNQNDLQIVPGEFGVQVYLNASVVPTTAQRSKPNLPATSALSWPSANDVMGWQPVLTGLAQQHAATGRLSEGTVYAGYAPAGDFRLSEDGRPVAERSAFGWAGQYSAAVPGEAKLSFHQIPYVPLAVLLEFLGWILLAALLLGWRRWPLRGSVPSDQTELLVEP